MTDTPQKRVCLARKMTGLTRKEFGEKYSISVNTLRSWETPKMTENGISPKGAKKLASALDMEGISCTVNWLLSGAGAKPALLNELKILPEDHESWSEDEAIIKESHFFKTNNPHAITMIMPDDGLEPYICLGDYVGGIKVEKKIFSPFYGKICILNTTNYGAVIRKVVRSSAKGKAVLCSTNPNTSACPIITDADIDWLAEIIWIRKKSNTKV